jgi:oxygen-independent coproporphyrinogen III oxidase
LPGIYIHIPFCRKACIYCNFHFSISLAKKTALVEALIREMSLRRDYLSGNIETIYIGGGTPSLLDIKELELIFEHLHKNFTLNQELEITLEANPDDINKSTLAAWKKSGVNRLSLGIQTFSDEELIWMNRSHSAEQSVKAMDDLADTGFTNYSVDLIYGSPLLTNEGFKKNVQIILDRNIPHVSCYALTVEPRTKLKKLIEVNKAPDINDEKQAQQFELLTAMMHSSGYEHYEISNFAKPGSRSRHNSSYWQGKAYLGLGPSAHSFNGNNKRFLNISNNENYIRALNEDIIPGNEEILTTNQQLNELIMISLRTIEGLNLAEVERKFGTESVDRIMSGSNKYIKEGSVIMRNHHLVLTSRGKFLADGIAADLFELD